MGGRDRHAEPYPCQSRFSRQSRPSRVSQASAIAVEAFMNDAGWGFFFDVHASTFVR